LLLVITFFVQEIKVHFLLTFDFYSSSISRRARPGWLSWEALH
jgi:hypothetical protein